MAKRKRPRKKKPGPALITKPSVKDIFFSLKGIKATEETWWDFLFSLKPGQGVKISPNKKRLIVFNHPYKKG